MELFFVRSTVEKTHQSIIYRYNFQKSKLALIDKSIESIYDILAQKNAPLLQYIQSTIGVNEWYIFDYDHIFIISACCQTTDAVN